MSGSDKHVWSREARRPQPRPFVEQSRARQPDVDGKVDRDGVEIAYEVYGNGDPTILLMPTWSLVHSRVWKAQIPYLARHARVVTYDPRGNGRSDRPTEVEAHTDAEYAADALAVLDATNTDRAVVACLSKAACHALLLAAQHPARVDRLVFLGPALPLTRASALQKAVLRSGFERSIPHAGRWELKFNAQYWQREYRDFVESYVRAAFNDRHSTKQIEDAVGWGLETSPEVLLPTFRSGFLDLGRREALDLVDDVRCPVLVVNGDRDVVTPLRDAEVLAERTGGELLVLQGSGHVPAARNPVPVNVAIRHFAQPHWQPYALPAATPRGPKRVLYLSSPIGLGHARRDLAIVRALRERMPSVEVEWLTQPPVTNLLNVEGERVHPASAHLASETAHLESESHDHDLHVFQAIRRMDEIKVNNYMVVRDVVRDTRYDLVVGDEAFELDYFWHENPEEKVAPYAFLTDFVGWLPNEAGDEHERYLAADYNEEMIEHIAGQPHIRDLALFVGSEGDVVDDPLGPGLPSVREWTREHFDFTGYVTGFDPAEVDREALRHELGYAPDEKICLVTVGGSGVGHALLRAVVAAQPLARDLVPGLRMVVVTGPRIDPASLPAQPGLEVHGYVHDLFRHLLACDIAVVQGGLTTTMELVAARRPFLYFPLENHFEQQLHVPHRLRRYRAGRRMSLADAQPDALAAVLAEELSSGVDYLPVETDGHHNAAARLAELL